MRRVPQTTKRGPPTYWMIGTPSTFFQASAASTPTSAYGVSASSSRTAFAVAPADVQLAVLERGLAAVVVAAVDDGHACGTDDEVADLATAPARQPAIVKRDGLGAPQITLQADGGVIAIEAVGGAVAVGLGPGYEAREAAAEPATSVGERTWTARGLGFHTCWLSVGRNAHLRDAPSPWSTRMSLAGQLEVRATTSFACCERPPARVQMTPGGLKSRHEDGDRQGDRRHAATN
jgi:hypothetical protein